MNIRTVAVVLAVVLGASSGPGALASAEASRPPIDWAALALIAVGTLVCGSVVVGLQVMRESPVPGKLAVAFSGFIALATLAAGVGALAWAVAHSRLGPAAYLFLVVGGALSAAVALNRRLYRARFQHAL
jgi:hypothetical protein